MKKFLLQMNIASVTTTALIAIALLPFVAIGATFDEAGGLKKLFSGAVGFINSVLIPAVLALAFLVFVWGVFLYFVKGGADDEAQSKGKQLMLYAIGGFVLILIFFGVVNLLTTTIGLKEETITLPKTITI